MRPGDILSRVFDKPLAIMSTSSYRSDAGTVQGKLDIARYITTPKGEIAVGIVSTNNEVLPSRNSIWQGEALHIGKEPESPIAKLTL